MLLSPGVMRGLLIVCMLGMMVLAGLYLRRRPLSAAQYLGWGTMIVLLPLVGPFLVILLQPGMPRPLARTRRHRRTRRIQLL